MQTHYICYAFFNSLAQLLGPKNDFWYRKSHFCDSQTHFLDIEIHISLGKLILSLGPKTYSWDTQIMKIYIISMLIHINLGSQKLLFGTPQAILV